MFPQGPWIDRQALHAAGMDLQHPQQHRRVRFLAPLPSDFVAALGQLGLSIVGGDQEGSDQMMQAAIEAAWSRLEKMREH